jgi:hypothetical protein
MRLEMDAFEPKQKRPEDKIRNAIVNELTMRGWYCKITNGNTFQQGFPDIYATHALHGPRWIEVKRREKYRFTPAQLRDFPKFSANGSPIWVLTSIEELHLLFKSENWREFLK